MRTPYIPTDGKPELLQGATNNAWHSTMTAPWGYIGYETSVTMIRRATHDTPLLILQMRLPVEKIIYAVAHHHSWRMSRGWLQAEPPTLRLGIWRADLQSSAIRRVNPATDIYLWSWRGMAGGSKRAE
ncbi:hypothetical protein PGT21_011834 [Puccinia graminis f. sp. tritici]|uniref:Uncharacterized protein n=1 Tax=Puccinia graminis f. sp. tritici TaxID=56615 RepID=A0A5B0P6T9_PUCGR|nr:hypothetical protein PGTUg99_010081 [Puccinia graminis f. sp. tritici]KAA1105558.1 hypothetical protein PGT21_011834 [Puccinia graminis f. sp. tritici]